MRKHHTLTHRLEIPAAPSSLYRQRKLKNCREHEYHHPTVARILWAAMQLCIHSRIHECICIPKLVFTAVATAPELSGSDGVPKSLQVVSACKNSSHGTCTQTKSDVHVLSRLSMCALCVRWHHSAAAQRSRLMCSSCRVLALFCAAAAVGSKT